MRWEDSWAAASRNYDLYLFFWNGSSWVQVGASTGAQSGVNGQVPLEILSGGAPNTGFYCIAMARVGAAAIPGWLQVATFRQNLSAAVTSNSIGNPAESASFGMLAVGAANWQTTTTIESFSSRGPTRDNRNKPDITGADAADTVSYGPNAFFGTSQASPHVAGMAALVRGRFPAYTPQQTAQYLKDNAAARGSAPNNVWGYGFAELPAIPGDTTPPGTSIPTVKILADRQLVTNAGPPTTYLPRVQVKWTSAATDVDYYELQMSTNNGGSWSNVTLPNPANKGVQTTMPLGKNVRFRVRATDLSGNTGNWRSTPTVTIYGRQETSAAIVYTGTWQGPVAVPGSYGAKSRYTAVNGRVAAITFTGTEFAWVSTLGPNRGKAEVWLGATKLGTVDLYSATTRTRSVVFTRSWATSATRTIEIRVLGQHTAPSTGNRVDLDGYLYR
jgi:hypothetical protein